MTKFLKVIRIVAIIGLATSILWLLQIEIDNLGRPSGWIEWLTLRARPITLAISSSLVYFSTDFSLLMTSKDRTEYMVVIRLPDGKCFLEMSKMPNDEYWVTSYGDIGFPMMRFEDFHKTNSKKSYVDYVASSIFMIQISPHIISAPRGVTEPAKWCRQFCMKEHLTEIVLTEEIGGYFIEVNPTILEHSVLNVAKAVISSCSNIG